ncbi:MAG TPA: hypothetical protein O0X70_04295 [Methanocorpusculum sp.]|nr:hypothetical protein [Methanocorpusculum sp.]
MNRIFCKYAKYYLPCILILLWLAAIGAITLTLTGKLHEVSVVWFLALTSAIAATVYCIFEKHHKRIQPCEKTAANSFTESKIQNQTVAVDDEDRFIFKKIPVRRVVKLIDIIYYFGLLCLLLIVFFSAARDLPYIFAVSLLAVIAVLPVFLSNAQSVIFHALAKIIILFSVAVFSVFKDFYWIGRDVWKHAEWNYLIAQGGELVNNMGKEYFNPLQHIAVAVSDIFANVDIRTATLLCLTLPLVIILPVALYIAARQIVGPKYAVFAPVIGLFIGLAPHWAAYAVTTSYAFMLFALLLVPLAKLLFQLQNDSRKIWAVLFLLIVLAVALTHLFSSFVLFLFLGGIFLAFLVIDCKQKKPEHVDNAMLALSGMGLLAYYVYTTNEELVFNVFTAAFEKLGSIFSNIGNIFGISADVANVASAASPFAKTVDFNAIIQSCYTVVEENALSNIIVPGLRFCAVLIPFAVALCFAARYCFSENTTEKQRRFWYVLIPSAVVEILFLAVYAAYYPMVARPEVYLFPVIGILLTCIFAFYLKNADELKTSRVKVTGITLAVLFAVVFCGTLSVGLSDDYIGPFLDSNINKSHTYQEIDGLYTITGYLPEKTKTFIDNEMEDDTFDYAVITSNLSNLWHTNLHNYNPQTANGYLIFRDTLINRGTTYISKAGTNELTQETTMINISEKYPTVLDAINPRIYSNGELILWKV